MFYNMMATCREKGVIRAISRHVLNTRMHFRDPEQHPAPPSLAFAVESNSYFIQSVTCMHCAAHTTKCFPCTHSFAHHNDPLC